MTLAKFNEFNAELQSAFSQLAMGIDAELGPADWHCQFSLEKCAYLIARREKKTNNCIQLVYPAQRAVYRKFQDLSEMIENPGKFPEYIQQFDNLGRPIQASVSATWKQELDRKVKKKLKHDEMQREMDEGIVRRRTFE